MSGDPRANRPSVNGWNASFLESQYEAYRADPGSVPADVRAFFAGYDLASASGPPLPGMPTSTPNGRVGPSDHDRVEIGAEALVTAYRGRGHLAAKLDPFGIERERPAALSLEQFSLTEADLDTPLNGGLLGMAPGTTLRQLIDELERMYLGHVGVEYMYIEDYNERNWLMNRWESLRGRFEFSKAEKSHILELLVNSEAFEAFLQKRYQGEKRFSLEGAESLIALLDGLLDHLADFRTDEVVLGMAHRGRLNVLYSILGKTSTQIFTEFEDSWQGDEFADEGGDVKYHRGYSADRTAPNGRNMRLAMASNPSHLEAVDPVVLGRTRAKQRLRGDSDRELVVPVLIHGDAAIAGQGIVAECLNFSQLKGYTVGGTIHVVVNNHIGFTTRPEDARSTTYCTDIAKSAGCPVFHVNGEDPEAVVAVAQLAAEYRQQFKRDVFIDMWCYRKYGHNEQDEQSFTQPVRAKRIKAKQSVLEGYAARLFDEGVINQKDLDLLEQRVQTALDQSQQLARTTPTDPTIDPGSARWMGFVHEYAHETVETGVDMAVLREVSEALGRTPDDFNVNSKLKKLLATRASICDHGEVNYADAEMLAFGTLLVEGQDVRVSGQDSRRGTFSSRHAVFYDNTTAKPYEPLNNIRPMGLFGSDTPPGSTTPDGVTRQAKLCIYDSPLSEAGVLGFDYGYSLADPSMLVCWEAQFGDFSNGAQVIIDQFLATAQTKWERWSGLVLLLPHGYEGAGPEHSSARLERFLELCGNDNMQVVYPTTGAQIFHLLRRQVKRQFRKPLVVMTPKSMLRVVTSRIEELATGHFQTVIDDAERAGTDEAKRVSRVLLCTGKLYHELAKRRDTVGRDDTAIVRIEQLYPLDTERLRGVLGRYPDTAQKIWVQEEPRNMGAFLHIADMLREKLGITQVGYIGRDAAASPAPGSKQTDRKQQESVLERAIGAAVPSESQKPKAAATG
ncbi:MAG: 2-oxoglutarate dehydrogenase E1 component [Planctomycetota bacterium]